MNLPSKIISVCFLSATSIWLAGAASSAPISASLALRDAAGPAVQNVQWRGWRGRRGWGGFGGALMGGALAATTSPWYGYDYDYGPSYYGYGPGPAYSSYYSPGYAYDYGPYGPAPGPYLQSCGYVGGPKTGAWTCFR